MKDELSDETPETPAEAADELLLRRVGDAMGVPEALDDPRWDALAADQLSAEDVEALSALAAAEGLDDAPEAFAPLGPDFEAKMAGLFAEQKGAEVIPLRPARGRLAAVVVGVLAAAAALFLLFRPTLPDGALPPYQLEVVGGEKAVRGDAPAAALRLRPDSLLTVTLRPAEAARTPVELRLWLRTAAQGERAGALHRIEPPVERAASGVFVVEGTVAEVLGVSRPGTYELVMLLATRERQVEDVGKLLDGAGDGRQLFTRRVVVTD